ncbi:MAG: cbb3-type cytochrome oxidase assembly protein CcoS [Cocleimonas sp.]|nr:cbb3-type cytochrome oxidase assembly protein CcoS [Cocleimonas sp.]
MDALTMTILLGMLVMLIVVIAFVLTVKSGQYDDLDGVAFRILMDDDDPLIPGNQPIIKRESEEKVDKVENKK